MENITNHSTLVKGHVGIIGAGIIGLASALWLQRAGYTVTIIDREDPGLGASFGNAGVLANFARLPSTRFSTLVKVPNMLRDPDGPLSISRNYLSDFTPYGWSFFKSCFEYKKAREALSELQSNAFEADQVLLNLTGGQSLIRSGGSLALFARQESIDKALKGEMKERREQGVSLEVFNAAQVQDLEPGLEPFYAGGFYYPDTRFAVSPIELSRCYARHFEENGGRIVRDRVNFINTTDQHVTAQTSLFTLKFDHLVIAAGTASKRLISQLGLNIPSISERGYHVMIDDENKQLSRPISWLDKSIFMGPMESGIRLTGIAEFTNEESAPKQDCVERLKRHARSMLGNDIEFSSTWLGSRPSTPDALPIIGSLKNQPLITVAYGHSHLGLTLSAITGQLICETIQGIRPSINLDPFAPHRFA
jgi:D-amino-acid dehydrogenase